MNNVVLIDISSSLVNGLKRDSLKDTCVEFYKGVFEVLSHFKHMRLYVFPALYTSDSIQYVSLEQQDFDNIAKIICNPSKPRETPLINSIYEVLKREKDINMLIIVSDLLSNEEVSRDLVDNIVNELLNKKLLVIWIENEQFMYQSGFSYSTKQFRSILEEMLSKKQAFIANTSSMDTLLGHAESYGVLTYVKTSIRNIHLLLDSFLEEIKYKYKLIVENSRE